MRKNFNNQQGRSMIEIIGVLSIMAIITVISIIIGDKGFRTVKLSSVQKDVFVIDKKLSNIYSSKNYNISGKVLGSNMTFKSLFVNTGILPEENIYGSKYSFSIPYVYYSGEPKSEYYLQMGVLKDEDCAMIVKSANWSEFPSLILRCIGETKTYESNKNSTTPMNSNDLAVANGYSTASNWNKACYDSNDEDSEDCQSLRQNPSAIDSSYAGSLCAIKDYEWACQAILEYNSNPDIEYRGVYNYETVIACNKGKDSMCDQAILDIENGLKGASGAVDYGCYSANTEKEMELCDYLKENPEYIGQSGQYSGHMCSVSGYDWACTALKENFYKEDTAVYQSLGSSCVQDQSGNNTMCDWIKNIALNDEDEDMQEKAMKSLGYACGANIRSPGAYPNDEACKILEANPELYSDYYKKSLCINYDHANACQAYCGADTCP